MTNQYIEIYSDGSCSVNPGPMGAAAVTLIKDKDTKDIRFKMIKAAFFGDGTNNRAEIHGVILGLRAVKPDLRALYDVTVYCDSQWVIGALSGTYKSVKKNLDLLSLAAKLALEYKNCSFQHVVGHAGHTWNELADTYAVAARTQQTEFCIKDFEMPLKIPVPGSSFEVKL